MLSIHLFFPLTIFKKNKVPAFYRPKPAEISQLEHRVFRISIPGQFIPYQLVRPQAALGKNLAFPGKPVCGKVIYGQVTLLVNGLHQVLQEFFLSHETFISYWQHRIAGSISTPQNSTGFVAGNMISVIPGQDIVAFYKYGQNLPYKWYPA
jgi:hypothetical protein